MKHTVVIFFFLSVVICPVSAQDTVLVHTGWNIIGSLGSGIVPTELVTVPPGIITTAMYGYNPGAGYESSDTLEMGRGYWVKVSADGIILFEISSSDECGIKRVEYGGFSYGTVEIGSQCWLEENLNVGAMVLGVAEQTNNAVLEKYCYGDDPVNCGVYGGFYQWDEAMQYTTAEGAQGICPPGWHIPTKSEYQTLSSTVGDDGNALKKGGVGSGDGLGTNTSGFSALLAGFRHHTGLFAGLGLGSYFWGTTEGVAAIASSMYLAENLSDIYINDNLKLFGFSVRCLED